MMYRLDAESLEPFDATDDIQDGVYGTDFMQVHLLRSHAVDATLSLTQQSEGADRTLLDPVGYRRSRDESNQLIDVATVRLRGDVELDLLASNAGPAHVSNRNTDIAYAQPAWQLLEPGDRHTEREKSR
jgi:hypothetical protein